MILDQILSFTLSFKEGKDCQLPRSYLPLLMAFLNGVLVLNPSFLLLVFVSFYFWQLLNIWFNLLFSLDES